MTHLQLIVQEIIKLDESDILNSWKKAIEENRDVVLIDELRKIVKQERAFAVRVLGEAIVQMIEQFNPLKEAEVYLGDLMELYKERKDLRQWDKIRVKVAECNMLLEMAGTKLK